MIGTLGRAIAAQTPVRFGGKVLLSTVVVFAAAFANREGFALALLVIFSGITGPAIRIMTLKMSGMYDRLIASPVSKPALVLWYTGIWSAAVLIALVPAIGISVFLTGPSIILPVTTGAVLAVTVGTFCGLTARTLGDAHLFAILATLPLLAGAVVPGPWALVLPFSSIASAPATLTASLSQACFTVIGLAVLSGVAIRM